MKITATQNETFNQIIFTWSDDMKNCDFLALGICDKELDDTLDRMMLCGVHEGNDYKGWNVTIKL